MRPADGSALRKIRASHGSLKLNVVIDGAYPMEWIVAGEDEFGLDGTLTCERWRTRTGVPGYTVRPLISSDFVR